MEHFIVTFLIVAVPIVAVIVIVRDGRKIEAATAPDLSAGYRTVATVSGIRYQPPKVSADGYWEVVFSLDGKVFTVPVTEAVALGLKAGDGVAVTAYPCLDRSRGICDVVLAGPVVTGDDGTAAPRTNP